MIKETKTLASGRKLELQHADFDVAMALLQAVARELLKVGIDVKVNPRRIQDLLNADFPVAVFKDALCNLVASVEVLGLVRQCMARCLYQGQAIGETTFESVEAREDFLEIAQEVMMLNLRPFLGKLLSRLPNQGTRSEDPPK